MDEQERIYKIHDIRTVRKCSDWIGLYAMWILDVPRVYGRIYAANEKRQIERHE